MFTKSLQGYAILSSNPVEKGACPMPRQSQNQPSRKKALLSVAILLALTGVLILLFQDHWAEISAALAQLSLGQVALVLALGITYPLLEGVASWLIVRSRLPGFTLRHGIDNAWMGTFGNVICLGAGAVPMQTYYLHRCGLGLGPGVGLMTLQYVFHKASVLVYATVLLLWNRQWFTAHATGFLCVLSQFFDILLGEEEANGAHGHHDIIGRDPEEHQVQLLTALMLFLSNALPNVAGMGSIETAFLLVFGAFLKIGRAHV